MKICLALFDIDGTLVDLFKHHTPSYQIAISEEYNIIIPPEEIESYYGKPARKIVFSVLNNRSIEEINEARIERILNNYASNLRRRIKEDSRIENPILPGVEDLLIKLQQLEALIGVVSGNVKIAGEAIPTETGLSHYFHPRLREAMEIMLTLEQK